MVSTETRNEIESTLGQVPSFLATLPEPVVDHSWGIVRDLELGETDLPMREKALVGLGAAAAIQCPYCVHFHTEAAKMGGVTQTEVDEAVAMAGTTRYFSTVLHGNEIEYDEFVEETADIVAHLERQEAAAGAD